MLEYGKELLFRTLPTPLHAQLWEKFARLFLFVISFASPSVCRTYFYLESLLMVFQSLIPQSMNLEFGDMLFYTKFFPCLTCSIFVTLLTFALRDLVYIDAETHGPKIALLIPVLIF